MFQKAKVPRENKTKNVKLHLIKKDNVQLLFGSNYVSEFDIFTRNLNISM